MGLERGVRGALRRETGVQLAASRRRDGARSRHAAPPIHVNTRGVERGVHVGTLTMHQLEGDDRLAELPASRECRANQIERRRHEPQRAPGEHHALVARPLISTAHGRSRGRAGSPPDTRQSSNSSSPVPEPRMRAVELGRGAETAGAELDDEGRDYRELRPPGSSWHRTRTHPRPGVVITSCGHSARSPRRAARPRDIEEDGHPASGLGTSRAPEVARRSAGRGR